MLGLQFEATGPQAKLQKISATKNRTSNATQPSIASKQYYVLSRFDMKWIKLLALKKYE